MLLTCWHRGTQDDTKQKGHMTNYWHIDIFLEVIFTSFTAVSFWFNKRLKMKTGQLHVSTFIFVVKRGPTTETEVNVVI